jgi:hypothetical protein
MRLGKVTINLEYVVDLDNEDMVTYAKDALYEDLMTAYTYNDIGDWIKVEEAPEASENDIPEFLLPEEEDDDEY